MGNLFARFRRFKEARVLMQGLDAAGKTTVLYRLKLGEVVTTIPTIGFNVETLEHKNISFTAWDVGGRDKMRPLWRHYYPNTQALIYVVDSNDLERLDQACEELHTILREDELKDTVLLVMANKQDLPGAASVEKITEGLKLHTVRQRQWYIVPTAAVTGDGLYEGLDWLSQTLSNGQMSPTAGEHTKDSPKPETTEAVKSSKTPQDANMTRIISKSWEIFKSLFVAT